MKLEDSDDKDYAAPTMLGELPRPQGAFWFPREYICAARPLANQLEQFEVMREV